MIFNFKTKTWREHLAEAAAADTDEGAAESLVRALIALVKTDTTARLVTTDRVSRIVNACKRAGWTFGLSGIKPPGA